jgi:anti-sigma regulatory factor (Ser/Thr protein kinase)
MAETFEQTMRIRLWADVRAPKSARQLVRQIDWLPAPAAEDAALVASELVSNAVAYAALAEAEVVELRFSRAAEGLMIEAGPAGMVTGPGRSRASKSGARELAEGVLGVAVVDGVADDWGIIEGSGWAALRF